MTTVNRSAQFAKLHKVLKKHYKPAPNSVDRSVVEHLLFACCLEGAHYDAAEEAFAALVHTFFDWNEVRVTSISELAEVMACLPDPRAAANRVKRVLHAVFEATFNFDLEERRKKNLGPTVEWLQKLDGTTPFVVSYVVQAALGGHAIPIDAGTMAALHVLDYVTDKDVESNVVPGLERAIPKAKGHEFGSLLHELGADFGANPYSANIRNILTQIEPDCGSRLPKRRIERAAKEPEKVEKHEKAEKREKAEKPEKAAAAKEPEATAKPAAKKKAPAVAEPAPEAAKKKAPPAPAAKHAAEKSPPRAAPSKKPTPSEGLSKRKPK
jgi:endonuclease III